MCSCLTIYIVHRAVLRRWDYYSNIPYIIFASLPSSQIPSNLGTHLTNLVELDISRNSLCGEIPSSIGGIRKVKRVLVVL